MRTELLPTALIQRIALVLALPVMGCAHEEGVHLITKVQTVSSFSREDAQGILSRFRAERAEFYDCLKPLRARDGVVLEYDSEGGYGACAIVKSAGGKYHVVTSRWRQFVTPPTGVHQIVMSFVDDSGWAASTLECLSKSIPDGAVLPNRAPLIDTDHVAWAIVSLFSGKTNRAMLLESFSLLWPLDPELGERASVEARGLASRVSEMMKLLGPCPGLDETYDSAAKPGEDQLTENVKE